MTLCVLLVVAGTVASTRQEEIPDAVKTRRFDVINKDGNSVVALGVSWKDGAGSVSVANTDGV